VKGAKRAFEFRVVKFVPNAVHGMTANIGVILAEVESPDRGFADIKLADDWKLARILDPLLDIDLFEALAIEIRENLHSSVRDRSMGGVEVTRREWMEHVLEDWCSNGIQVSEPRAVMTDDPVRELSRLVKMYCNFGRTEVKVVSDPRRVGRAAIVFQMRKAFEQYGVIKHLQKQVDVSALTGVGNAWKIDYAYRYPKEVRADLNRDSQYFKMFHAVSLRKDADAAEILAARFQEFRSGLEDKLQAEAKLTAIVETGLDRESPFVKFAYETFKEKNVEVATLAQMPGIAERARKELAA
jgi:hypothetical protein